MAVTAYASGSGPATGPGPLVVSAEGRRWQFAPGTRAVVGRDPSCQVVLTDNRVSRRHLELAWESGAWFVRDLGSANGTFQDGRPVRHEPVGTARAIRLGHATGGPLMELVVHASMPGQASPAAPQSPLPPTRVAHPPAAPGVSRGTAPGPGTPTPTPPTPTPIPAAASPAPPASPVPPGGGSPPASAAPVGQAQPAGPVGYSQPGTPPPGNRPPAGPPAAPPVGQPPGAPPPGAPAGPRPGAPAGEIAVRLTGPVRIGRDPENDLVLTDLLVSRRHTRIDPTPYGFQVSDLGSSNRTFVNGVPVTTAPLQEGALLTVGRTRFVLQQGVLRQVREEPAAGLAIEHLNYILPDGKILTNNVSLRLNGPKLVAVLGPSGAGKSTILRLVSGEVEPTSGRVLYQNVDVHTHYAEVKSRIGMVPQHTVAHTKLTARYTLRYAAELRLSGDITAAERERRVDQVLGELGLTQHADTRVDRLSGGQQRRLAIGFELLTRTSLLLLDEPTSGLDPALSYEVMKLLRRLADEGRQVLVTTHDTADLNMCDLVIVMAANGHLAFVGPPDQIPTHFGTTEWPEIFSRLAAAPEAPRQPVPPGSKRRRRPPAPPALTPAGGRARSQSGRQFGVLVRRQIRLMFADPRYVGFLALMPVVLAVLALVVTGPDGMGSGSELPENLQPGAPVPAILPNPDAQKLLLVLIVGATFMGMASTVRELVGERPIFQYERSAGLTPEAYLLSKLVVFSVVVVVQSVVLVLITRMVRPGPDSAILLGSGTLEIVLAVAFTAMVSAVLGLLVSSFMTTVEQTMPPLVVVVMAQLVLSGGLGVEVYKSLWLAPLSWLTPARWGFASAAGTINIKELQPRGPADPLWSHEAWVLLLSFAVLAVMAVGFSLLTLRMVRRR